MSFLKVTDIFTNHNWYHSNEMVQANTEKLMILIKYNGSGYCFPLMCDVHNTLIMFYKQRSDLATSLRFLVLLICVA